MARDIAEGMAFLHALTPAIIHRDLKPGNVLLMEVDTSNLLTLEIALGG